MTAVRPPEDERLPRIGDLFSRDAMASVFARTLTDPDALVDVEPRYLRYKPGTNLVVQYEVRVASERRSVTAFIAAGANLERRSRRPESVALARLVDGRTPAARPLHYDADVRCLVQWFPLDISMPPLAEPPSNLHRLLQAAGVTTGGSDTEAVPLAYKPRRRAVCAFGEHVLKFYAGDDEFRVAATGLAASAQMRSIRAPAPVAVLPEKRLTVQTFIRADQPMSPLEIASQAGALLGVLHRSRLSPSVLTGLRRLMPHDQFRAAAASGHVVAAIHPGLAPRVRRLTAELERATPRTGPMVPTHGDFNPGQLLLTADGLALTDFDDLCLAAPARDPAIFATHLLLADVGDGTRAAEGLEALLNGYGGRPAAMRWYLASTILREAAWPFRYLEPAWPERVDWMVAAAEKALAP